LILGRTDALELATFVICIQLREPSSFRDVIASDRILQQVDIVFARTRFAGCIVLTLFTAAMSLFGEGNIGGMAVYAHRLAFSAGSWGRSASIGCTLMDESHFGFWNDYLPYEDRFM
jgi:hypothetical protein